MEKTNEMVGMKTLKKILIPMIYVVEWVLFLYVLICVFTFNMIHFGNIIYVDMPWEEPMTLPSSFTKSLLIILGIGVVCFFYIKYLFGNGAYKRFKLVIWGILFAVNALGSGLCLSMIYGFNLNTTEAILLLIVTLVSAALTIQSVMKYYMLK